tara:strand:- start:470 stop:895 length:426 start_codon:yes stop_codon:yes gene_type:complete
MALANSGTMSIGGTSANRSINLELGEPQNATSGLGDTDLRNLAGVASGAISMSDFYGASAGTCTSYSSTTVQPTEAGGCSSSVNQTYYHSGSGSFPTTGDYVYSNSGCTTGLSAGYCKIGTGFWILIDGQSRVSATAACRK